MTKSRLTQILDAAAALPPAKGRAVLRAVAAKDARESRDAADFLAEAVEQFEIAMGNAVLAALEESLT